MDGRRQPVNHSRNRAEHGKQTKNGKPLCKRFLRAEAFYPRSLFEMQTYMPYDSGKKQSPGKHMEPYPHPAPAMGKLELQA